MHAPICAPGSQAALTDTHTADTSPASDAPDDSHADGNADASAAVDNTATPPTAALIFAATAGNLVQAAAAKGAGTDTSQSSGVSSSAPVGNKGKAGAMSIADKLSWLLGAAGNGNNATAQTQAPATPATAPNAPAGNTPANESAPGATDVAGIIAAVRAALAGPNTDAAPSDSSDKPSASSQDSKDDSSDSAQDSGAAADANATASAQQLTAQPIAAAITVNTQISAPQTSGKTSADIKVGDAGKSAVKLAMALSDGKDGTPAPKDTGPAVQAPSPAAGNPQVSKPTNAAIPSNAPATDSADDEQSQAADSIAPAQTSGIVSPATGDQPAPRAEANAAAVTPETPSGQTASPGAKADITGMPNFGITATAAAAPAPATTAPAATNPANTVPVAGLAVAIASRVQAGSSQFDIRLDPPELGRIEVRLGVDRDGRVTSHITVDRADTLQLLQNQQPQLQQSLDQAGLKTADNGLQFSLRDQSFANQNNNSGNGTQQQNTPALVIPDADLPPVQSAQIYNRLGLGSGVDIRV